MSHFTIAPDSKFISIIRIQALINEKDNVMFVLNASRVSERGWKIFWKLIKDNTYGKMERL